MRGTFVEGGVSLDLYRLFFSRTVLNRPKHDLSVGIGLHGLNIGAFIEGELRTSEGDREFDRRDVAGLIPLPNIGVSYEWYPHKRWMLGADGQSPNDEIDFNETFSLSDTDPTYFFQVGWRFSKRLTVSLQSFGVRAEDGAILERDLEFKDIVFCGAPLLRVACLWICIDSFSAVRF